jgi:hypothetical protein
MAKSKADTPAVEHKLSFRTNGLDINPDKWKQRVLIGTPMTGLVRAEWVAARYNQSIPTNWSQVEYAPFMFSHIPLRYQVADAENMIAKLAVEKDFEWLWFIEHDNVLPPNAFIFMNEYMIEAKVPVVSALYFTKSVPPEPILYRRFGWGHYKDFKMGDKVWCVGIPFGCTLIHMSLIRALWKESPEYVLNGQVVRRVFQAPNEQWFDADLGIMKSTAGTSDLQWCERLVKDKIFEKAGWPEYQKMEYPFLVDTNLFVQHIDENGIAYPLGGIPPRYMPDKDLTKIKEASQVVNGPTQHSMVQRRA